MNKIICDVCGTAYQETATQCPICGCVRTPDMDDVLNENTYGDSARTYTYVKGGRFSKANVKKRNKNNAPAENAPAAAASRRKPSPKKKNTGLVIAIIILLLAIVAVVIYMAVTVFLRNSVNDDQPTFTEDTAPSTAGQIEPEPDVIPCEELTLEAFEATLTNIGEIRKIHPSLKPENTTDVPRYESSDPSVVTVTQDGVITAVGHGTAEIRVTCGKQEAVCTVVCNIEEPTEDTTGVNVEVSEYVVSAEEVWLNNKDFTLSFAGETHTVYAGKMNPEDLEWISNNETFVKFENGKAIAVSHRSDDCTTIHVEYNEENISGYSSILVTLHDSVDDKTCKVTCTDENGEMISGVIENSKVVFENLDTSMTYSIQVRVSCKVYCMFNSNDQGIQGSAGPDGGG